MSIPINDEHLEATQAETDANRAAIIAQMPPEDQARAMVVESVVKQLEGAKIPFALWASVVTEGWHFVRFQRLDYTKESQVERAKEQIRVLFYALAPSIVGWIGQCFGSKWASFWGADKELLFGYDMTEPRTKVLLPSEDEKT